MIELVMLWLISAAFAEPETLPEPADSGPVVTADGGPGSAPGTPIDPSFEGVLDTAKQKYFRGESSEARELLEGLQLRLYAGEEADWSSVVEALTYLGEIYYVQGDQDQAQMAFRFVLERDPSTPISPYHHAIEVVNLFELVRRNVVASRIVTPVPVPVPVTRRSPAPLSTFVPFGVPQLAQRRTALGVLYGSLQLGFGVASVALFPFLDRINGDGGGSGHPLGWEPPEISDRVQRRRYLLQWPATFAFYTTWGVSVIDAARWHQRHPRVVGIGLAPPLARPDGSGVPAGASPPVLVIGGQL
jgi:hypothetical protein